MVRPELKTKKVMFLCEPSLYEKVKEAADDNYESVGSFIRDSLIDTLKIIGAANGENKNR